MKDNSLEIIQMRMKIIYQLKMISGRLEVKVIHAKPVFGNVEFLIVCLVVN